MDKADQGEDSMKRTLVAFIFIHASALWAGESASSQPKPNPELKKQDFFVGNWTLAGETKPSPVGPGEQKFQSTERLQWMPANCFLLVIPTRAANGWN
jgi:hypothetical protein